MTIKSENLKVIFVNIYSFYINKLSVYQLVQSLITNLTREIEREEMEK